MATDWAKLASFRASMERIHEADGPAKQLAEELVRFGFTLSTDKERLIVSPKGQLTSELSQRIREHKAALMAIVCPPSKPLMQSELSIEDQAMVAAIAKLDERHGPLTFILEQPGGRLIVSRAG